MPSKTGERGGSRAGLVPPANSRVLLIEITISGVFLPT